MTDQTPGSELERAYLEPEPFQLQDEVTSLTRDLSASAGLFQRSLDMIGRLQEKLAAKPADDLAQACIAQLVESGAENYTEHHFEFTVDGEDVERPAVVTVKFSDRPSPHELRMKAEAERDTAQAQLAEAVGLLREVNSQRFTTPATVEIIESFIGRHSQTFHDHAQAKQQDAQGAQAGDTKKPTFKEVWRRVSRSGMVGKDAAREVWQEAFRAALATQPDAVSDLLAVIHRDGGHYQAQHGLDKAAREAEAIVQAERDKQPATGEPLSEVAKQNAILEQIKSGLEGVLYPHAAAGEPVAWMYHHESLIGPPTVRYERRKQLSDKWTEVPLYTAPPAAAHGDEAVRGKLLAALIEERKVRLLGQQPDVHWESMRDMRRECYAKTDAAIDAAMRAQGDGETS